MPSIKGLPAELPGRSLALMALYAAAVVVFVLALIVPAQMRLKKLDADINREQTNFIQRQKLLNEFTSLDKIKVKDTFLLPTPPETLVSTSDLDKVFSLLKALAKDSDIMVTGLSPDMNEFSSASGKQLGHLTINMKATGDFKSLRKFLIGAGGMPFVEHIREVEVKKNFRGEWLDLKFKIVVPFRKRQE